MIYAVLCFQSWSSCMCSSEWSSWPWSLPWSTSLSGEVIVLVSALIDHLRSFPWSMSWLIRWGHCLGQCPDWSGVIGIISILIRWDHCLGQCPDKVRLLSWSVPCAGEFMIMTTHLSNESTVWTTFCFTEILSGMGIGRGSADFRWKKNVRPPPKIKWSAQIRM